MTFTIHHVNLPAPDMQASARFYEALLGLAPGTWTYPRGKGDGDLSADPAGLRLYPSAGASRGANAGLHLITPEPGFARRHGLDHNATVGGHVAIQVPDLDPVIERLDTAGIPYSLTGEYAIPGMRHLYVYDPGMNLLEINDTAPPPLEIAA
ncbi:MAG: VOC family protein [Pseudomonadota bacterium]